VSRAFLPLLAALVAATSCGCGEGRAAPRSGPAAPESRPAAGGLAPAAEAIVAREGDRLLVILDVAGKDAQGRAVASVAVDAGGPAPEVRGPSSFDGAPFTLEVRVPGTTRSITLQGRSEGGATWSREIPTALDAR
jgi:hypothetical protein